MDRPDGIVDFEPSAEYFPFESRWFASSVGPIHYIDEGNGRPLLLMHGNPDWSFLYRKIVVGLRDRFRCVVMDYPGFGLSVQPDDSYGFTPAEHAVVAGELVEHLDLQDIVVMGQDWGGPIGMDVASRMPERIGGLVMGNTWFWPTDSLMMNSFSWVMGTAPFQALITKRNFFVTPMMKRILKAELTETEFEHYVAVVPTPRSRRGIAMFPIQIRAAKSWLAELEQRVKSTLGNQPIVVVWGMKDPAFGGGVLEHWRTAFPQATVIRLEAAGHYIQEDAPEQIVDAIATAYGPDNA
ncbi:MAG: haloalkane dehalogenase [Acidimicrobiia bacterium]|nr:MAG: haloalkane dehalogenase [Acidimicrobiia bacterium]